MRGVLFHVWGDACAGLLDRAIASVKRFGYDYKVVVDDSSHRGFRKRIGLFGMSPFDTTLYLDADAQVIENIDFGFEMAEKYGHGEWVDPGEWAFLGDVEARDNLFKDVNYKWFGQVEFPPR